MFKSAFMIFMILFSACDIVFIAPAPAELNFSGHESLKQLDAVFYTTIEPISNTCDREYWRTGWSNLYEVFLRLDGKYDLQPYFDSAEWPLSFIGATLENNNINHVEQWRSGYTNHIFNKTVKGSVTKDQIDLTIQLDWEMRDDVTLCYQSVRIHGTPWKIYDTTSVDGRYNVVVNSFVAEDLICPGDTETEYPLGHFLLDVIQPNADTPVKINFFDINLRGDLKVLDDKFSFTTNEGYYLQIFEQYQGFTSVWSSANGHIKSDDLNIMLKFKEFKDDVCFYKFHVIGKKSVPGPSSVEGEYSVENTRADTCANTTESRYSRLVVIDQGDSIISIFTEFDRPFYTRLAKDNTFNITLNGNIFTSSFTGRFTSLFLNLDYTFKQNNKDCGIESNNIAQMRFTR